MDRRLNENLIAHQKESVSTIINIVIGACVIALILIVITKA